MDKIFSRFARYSSLYAGTWQAFTAAVLMILIWIGAGFYFGFTDPLYQLWINTITTIITFVMVFLLQHAQNHDTLAMQIKLDELIRATTAASNQMQKIEDLNEAELRQVREQPKPKRRARRS